MVVRLRIFGRVQGVGYRAWLAGQARANAVDGWVRNRLDETVEAVLAGEPAVVQALVDRCRRGLQLARVERIETTAEAEAPPPGFVQRSTI